ncbi:MAG: 7-cyano-7-deazaguanine synthase QueC [Planctomycetia bacterium]
MNQPSILDRRALVLFSGGQDSTTCLYWAIQNFPAGVVALGFDYGQRHKIELEQAAKIAAMAGAPFHVLNTTGLLGDSALTDPTRGVDGAHPREASLPATFVPGRNLIFLSLAASFAYSRGMSDLVTGVCQTDFSGYPDCRRVFIESLETTLSLALAPRDFRIHTPLMYLDKADTFKLAADLGALAVVLEHSHTDYNGDRTERHPWGYGRLDNDASRLRAKGWEEYTRRYGPPPDA